MEEHIEDAKEDKVNGKTEDTNEENIGRNKKRKERAQDKGCGQPT